MGKINFNSPILIIGIYLIFIFVGTEGKPVQAKHNNPDQIKKTVLGYNISCAGGTEECRLVDRSGTEVRTVWQGKLETCEQELLKRLKGKYGTGQLNLPLWTLGGKQFWADVFIYHGWRIQRNVFTGHCRLLDSEEVRKAWGDYAACRTAFAEYRREKELEANSSHWIFLIHGLFRAKESMASLKTDLSRAGYEANTVNYPSTQKSIEDHARQLRKLIRRADGAETVSFVTHSLGGIIVRKLFELSGWQKQVKPGRIVMIAPPNKGSQMAELMKDFLPYELLAGKSGEQLTEEYVRKLPVPNVEIGIIAGSLDEGEGWNPLVSGNDDGTISVKTTKLKGAQDFLKVGGLHSFLPGKREVINATRRFLQTGKFSRTKNE